MTALTTLARPRLAAALLAALARILGLLARLLTRLVRVALLAALARLLVLLGHLGVSFLGLWTCRYNEVGRSSVPGPKETLCLTIGGASGLFYRCRKQRLSERVGQP